MLKRTRRGPVAILGLKRPHDGQLEILRCGIRFRVADTPQYVDNELPDVMIIISGMATK